MAQMKTEYVESEEVIIHNCPRISGEEPEFITIKFAIRGGLIMYGIVGGPLHQMRRNSTEHKLDPTEIHNIATHVYNDIHSLEEDYDSVRKLHSQMPEEEKHDETEYAFDPLQFEEEIQPPKVRRLLSDDYQQFS